MREEDELTGMTGIRSNLTPWLHVFEHRGENCSGLLQSPLGELGLNEKRDVQCPMEDAI